MAVHRCFTAASSISGCIAGDDWKVRQNITLSLGLRYEAQTNIHDHRDFAPRIGLAWAPGATAKKASKTVIRAGFGLFYTRFDLSNTFTAERYNGMLQQQYVLKDPAFFVPGLTTSIADIIAMGGIQSTQTKEEISSTLRAPYLMQSALSVERQLPGHTSLAVTYTNSHGLHMFRSEDINAPGAPGNWLYLMESSGLYNQNQLITNINSRLNRNVSLFGFYTLNYARSNTDGISTFSAVPYSLAGEYGPASTDVRNRVFFGGSIESRWGIRFSPFITAQTGAPYNITTGSDLFDDTLFNARPGVVADAQAADFPACGTPKATGGECSFGGIVLDPNPLNNGIPKAGETILPRNFGRGPGAISFNARLSKTFGFGALCAKASARRWIRRTWRWRHRRGAAVLYSVAAEWVVCLTARRPRIATT